MMASYAEGDWFAVPLRDHGFAVGLIARVNRGGVLLGYFFGPRRPEVPPIDKIDSLDPSVAQLITKFGHLGIVNGAWPLIGASKNWDRARWPMPTFARYEELTGRMLAVSYDADNPNRVLNERLIAPDSAQAMPKDGLLGSGAAELRLTRLLGGHS
jgi:hypothetical protein